MTGPFEHVPVMAAEVLEWLGPALKGDPVLVDCTLGGGGHAERFLDRFERLRLIGIDKDSEAIAAATQRLGRFGSRFTAAKGDFAAIDELIREQGFDEVSAVLYDLGVSSPQLDRAERGFRLAGPAPLDMRMDASSALRAEDVVNNYSLNELSRVISRFGEERFARRIAAAIVRRRANRPFETTEDLADVVKHAIPAATRRTGRHPARRTFQAIRIEVNKELESIAASLPAAIDLLSPDGRIAAISYHSLEDRIVKRTFVAASKGCTCPRDLPVCVCGKQGELKVLTAKALRPSPEEKALNPRSESARLRVARKMGRAA